MIEIKFRAWDCECSHMLSHEDLVKLFNDGGSLLQLIFTDQLNRIKKNLMRFTGLKDCSGVDIYEGDIIDCCGSVEVVSMQVGSKVEYGQGDSTTTFSIRLFSCWGQPKNIKVIGNIHQNPELLEPKQ